MDVRAAAYGRGVVETVRGGLDRLDEVPLRLAVGRRVLQRAEGPIRQDRAGPRPEVLRGHVGRDLTEVLIHVVGGDVDDPAVVVDILEELLAGQIAAAPDDRCQATVAQADLDLLARLAPK